MLFTHRIATSGQIGNIGTQGIELRIGEHGDWFGARVVLKSSKGGDAHIDVLPQIGARHRDIDEPLEWFLEKELNADFAAKYAESSEFRILGTGKAHERLEKKLTKLIPSFKREGSLTPPMGRDGKVGLGFERIFDGPVRRLLAKIAFNFLAWVTGAEFALRPDFDALRNFVRYGTEPATEIVRVGRRPILANEIVTGTQMTNGHVITVEAMPEKALVLAQLALFNSLKYRIVLSESYSGVWFAKGLHFDIEERSVTELEQTRSVRVARQKPLA